MARSFKVLAIHKQMFPATYNFRDLANGTSGTDIPFVDTANLYNGACEIVSDWQGHKKVLRLQDDETAAEDPIIYHNETQATAGTREFYIGTNDVTEAWDVIFYEVGLADIVRLYVNGSELQYYDNLDVFQTIQAVANDTLYLVKVVWRADNTFDVWVDGIKRVDNVATNNDMVSGIDRSCIRGRGDSTDYFYLDAYGDPDNDANYKIGDNCFWRHYKESAADTFEEDDMGTQGTNITWVDTVSLAAATEIVSESNEHKKVLRQIYSGAAVQSCEHNFVTASTSGSFSAWIKTADCTDSSLFRFQEDGTANYRILFRIDNDKFQRYTGAAWRDVTGAPVPLNNTWYYIFIQWYADNTFDIWINNIQYDDGTANGFNFTGSGIDAIFVRCETADSHIYIDAPISSLDGNERGDNRLFAYNSTYTSEDITSEVENVLTTNRLGKWREGTLTSKETYQNSEIFVQIYDVNDKLAMEADLKKREQNPFGLYTYPLRDKNQDDLENESSNTFSADKIHDPTDSTSILKVILPNVSEADGDLILVDADTKTDTYSPTTVNYPDYKMLTDIGDLADSVVIIHANGKCYLDDDKASGTALDLDTTADHDMMSGVILVTDILETINYFVIKGDFNPDTGTRFVKVIDNVGTDKKRSWRYTNNNFKSQADVDNYAAAIESRIATIKIIKVTVQSVGAHNMGETMDYKYVDSVYNVPQANYYIIFEQINFNENENIIILSEGMIEESKYAAGYERPEEYTDSYASEIYDTDINTEFPTMYIANGSTESGGMITINANGEGVRVKFSLDVKIDITRDIIVTFFYQRIDNENDVVPTKKTFSHALCDGSVVAWTNVWNDIAGENLPAEIQWTFNVFQFTLPNANLNPNSTVMLKWNINDANGGYRVESASIRYYIKRSL